MTNQKKCHGERISCEPNGPAAYESICSGECCLPELMLALSKHAIVVSSWPQQKHMPVMLQMTLYGLTSEQTTNTGDGSRRAAGSCTKSTSNKLHQTSASCRDRGHKTATAPRQMRPLLSPNPDKRSRRFVGKAPCE